jgi:hypothetical protein
MIKLGTSSDAEDHQKKRYEIKEQHQIDSYNKCLSIKEWL